MDFAQRSLCAAVKDLEDLEDLEDFREQYLLILKIIIVDTSNAI